MSIFENLFKKPKKDKPSVQMQDEITGKTGTIVQAITPEADGIVSIPDRNGVHLEYPARISVEIDIDELNEVPQGTKVTVVDFDNYEQVCYIIPCVEPCKKSAVE